MIETFKPAKEIIKINTDYEDELIRIHIGKTFSEVLTDCSHDELMRFSRLLLFFKYI
jgi:hypothetical protein